MSPGPGKRQYASDWWWRAPFLVFMATRLVMILTSTERTTGGTIIETGSASRRSPSEPESLERAALTSSVQAARARCGQLPPAVSAMVSRGSHTSAGRSLMPSGSTR